MDMPPASSMYICPVNDNPSPRYKESVECRSQGSFVGLLWVKIYAKLPLCDVSILDMHPWWQELSLIVDLQIRRSGTIKHPPGSRDVPTDCF